MVKLVRDVMNRGVMACTPSTTVREAARRMTQHNANALVVVEEASGEMEGIVHPFEPGRRVPQQP
jgi:CBS domain-containing protein